MRTRPGAATGRGRPNASSRVGSPVNHVMTTDVSVTVTSSKFIGTASPVVSAWAAKDQSAPSKEPAGRVAATRAEYRSHCRRVRFASHTPGTVPVLGGASVNGRCRVNRLAGCRAWELPEPRARRSSRHCSPRRRASRTRHGAGSWREWRAAGRWRSRLARALVDQSPRHRSMDRGGVLLSKPRHTTAPWLTNMAVLPPRTGSDCWTSPKRSGMERSASVDSRPPEGSCRVNVQAARYWCRGAGTSGG